MLLVPCLLLIVAIAGCVSQETVQVQKKPNIILIVADDQGWGDLSHHGNSNLKTPNIDSIAHRGATFDRFFVSPVCSPTRAEVLTGRYAVRGGVYSTSAGGERLDLDETTVADLLRSAGYRTAAFGKWHNGMQYPYHPNGRGFEEFYGFCSGHWGHYFSPMLEHNGAITRGTGYLTDDFTNRAMAFMEEHRDEPFFIYLPYNTPHSPMQVPDRWGQPMMEADLQMYHRDPEKEDTLFTKAALAMCENIDWNVGRLTEKLKALDLTKETIFIYMSDNGPNSWRWNGDMKGRKGSTDEGGVRSPLFIQWPGTIKPGQVVPQIASGIDLLPTLLDLAGVPFQAGNLDGISLKKYLLSDDSTSPDRYLANHWGGRTSVRSQYFRLDHEDQLFDMRSDPGQRKDISSDSTGVWQSMKAYKSQWISEILSELPEEDLRTFPLGHPDFTWTQIPARDGEAHGQIERSNRWPNCSFYTNWVSTEDSISWNVDVVESGLFEVTLYYTCPQGDVGSSFEIVCGDSVLEGEITEAHDPPLVGADEDLVPRQESYVKDFEPMVVGTMRLEEGQQDLVIRAVNIPGAKAMDFRLLMFERIE